jgi:hypothetical protein
MAVIAIDKRDALLEKLNERYFKLVELMQGKPLKSNTDGCKKGHWVYPDKLVKVDSLELSLALGDFKNILDEFKKIK